jgi:hypothetical protein
LSLLSIVSNAANNVGIPAPTSIFGNTDAGAVRLLQLARRAAKNLSTRTNWTSLIVEHVFVASGSTTFALPADFDRMIGDTLWDRSRFWRMRGAMTPQQWQMYKSTLFGRSSIERRWRIRMTSGDAAGAAAVFEIDPAISTTDTSSTFVFEYVSSNWCRSATTFSLEAVVISAGGSAYVAGNTLTLAGGTFTAAAQLLVTGVSSTGAITAAQVSVPGTYTVPPSSPASVTGGAGSGATFAINAATFPGKTQADWAADTDVSLLDEDLLELGVIWRLQQRLGLAYLEEKDEYERQVDQAVARDGGNAILRLTQPSWFTGTYVSDPGLVFAGGSSDTSGTLTLDGETITLDGDPLTLP